MDKILVNGDTHREFISNTSRQLLQRNVKKQSNKKKSAKNVNAHFSEEGIDMAIKHKNRCLASLVLRERRINFPIRYHLTSIRMTISKTL